MQMYDHILIYFTSRMKLEQNIHITCFKPKKCDHSSINDQNLNKILR
jgi:hypothetical protein